MEISTDRLKELEKAEAKLQALEAGGVDNWPNYSDALADYRKREELNELIEVALEQIEEAYTDSKYLVYAVKNHTVSFTEEANNAVLNILRNLVKEVTTNG